MSWLLTIVSFWPWSLREASAVLPGTSLSISRNAEVLAPRKVPSRLTTPKKCVALLALLGVTQALRLPPALPHQLPPPILTPYLLPRPALSFAFQPLWSQEPRLLCSNSRSAFWHQTKAALQPFRTGLSPIQHITVTPFQNLSPGGCRCFFNSPEPEAPRSLSHVPSRPPQDLSPCWGWDSSAPRPRGRTNPEHRRPS